MAMALPKQHRRKNLRMTVKPEDLSLFDQAGQYLRKSLLGENPWPLGEAHKILLNEAVYGAKADTGILLDLGTVKSKVD
jgi:hypothetical protein